MDNAPCKLGKKRPLLHSTRVAVIPGVLSAFFWVLAYPPFGIAEFGYVFGVPLLLWLVLCQPGWRLLMLVGLGSGSLAFFTLLVWLRHVTWPGLICLSLVLGSFWSAWLCLAKCLLVNWRPGSLNFHLRATGERIFPVLVLSAGWVLLEWTRSWLFSGFPWATLAASQWERPAMLQILSITGAYGLSFLLLFFNGALTLTILKFISAAHRPKEQSQENSHSDLRPPAEFYLALSTVMTCLLLIIPSGYLAVDSSEPLIKVAAIQPAIEQVYGWNTQVSGNTMDTLRELTATAAQEQPDLILWPESVTPWPLEGHQEFCDFLETQVHLMGIPLLTGNYADLGDHRYYNTVALLTPNGGLQLPTYKKQKLVPLGEFVPFADWLPLERLVGEGSFAHGKGARIIPLGKLHIAPLICYEDVFPWISRRYFSHGISRKSEIDPDAPALPDIFYVAINNAWYGQEACHEQHLMHSVMRAVETRRPFVRCGINGWSGWIDEFGRIRQRLADKDGSIYFRGTKTMQIVASTHWRGKISLYMKWGNVFVCICGGLLAAGLWQRVNSSGNKRTHVEKTP